MSSQLSVDSQIVSRRVHPSPSISSDAGRLVISLDFVRTNRTSTYLLRIGAFSQPTSKDGFLRAPACTPARHTAVAGSAPHHQRTADVAGGRISHLDKFSERSNRVRAIGIHRWLNGHRKGLEQFALVTGDEFPFEPPEHVVDNRLRVANLRVSRPAAGLKAHMREFAAQHVEGYPILQSQRYRCCKRIHEPRDGRALFCHGNEDLSWQAVLVNSDR